MEQPYSDQIRVARSPSLWSTPQTGPDLTTPQFMAATGQVFRMGRLPTEHSRVRYLDHGYPRAIQTLE